MRRPNILLITADQWRGDCLGVVGHPLAQTPALDGLAEESALFENHFSPCAPCSPARASLYTGLYQWNHRVVSNGSPLDDRFDNLALAARRAGYRPTLFGYTDTGLDPRSRDRGDPGLGTYEEVLPGFDCRQELREDDKTWISWLKARGHQGSILADPHAVSPAPNGGVTLSPPAYGADETQTAFLVDKALEWLDEQEEAPWFAHLSFLRPHPPFVVPEPYASLFLPDQVPTPIQQGADPCFLSSLSRATAAASGFQPGLKGSVEDLTDNDFRRIRALYLGMIAEVDSQLGRLFSEIKARRQWDDTLIIFTTDHGEMLGDHGLLGKGGIYAESQHIPLIIKLPAGRGQRVSAYTSAVDIFPTLLTLWDAKARHVPNGRSLLPLATGAVSETATGKSAFWEYDFRFALSAEERADKGLTAQDCHLAVLRSKRWHYVYSPAFDPITFDLEADPHCLSPLPAGSSPQDLCLAETLLALLSGLRDETLASIRLPVD